MTMDSATVTLPFSEFTKLVQRATTNEEAVTALRSEIAVLRASEAIGDPHLVKTLLGGLLAARTTALFALGQLPPEETKGWPSDAVRTLGAALQEIKHLVPAEVDLQHHIDDLVSFVKAIEDVEKIRRARLVVNEKPMIERSGITVADAP